MNDYCVKGKGHIANWLLDHGDNGDQHCELYLAIYIAMKMYKL